MIAFHFWETSGYKGNANGSGPPSRQRLWIFFLLRRYEYEYKHNVHVMKTYYCVVDK